MANHTIKDPPEFTEVLRMLETTDPAHADVFNALYETLINNDAYLYARKAEKSTTISATLLAVNWTGEAAPFYYDLSLEGVTEHSIQEFLPPVAPDADDYETTEAYTVAYEAWEAHVAALQGADMYDAGQSDGMVTICAKGEKPAIDLPVRVILRG